MSKKRNLRSTCKYSPSGPFDDTGTGSLCMQVESDNEDSIKTITSKVNIQQLCRLCAEKCTVATSTSLLEPNPSLVFQLLHYFGIMIIPNDGMPTRVCRVCTHDLERFETLKRSVNKAQKYLKLHLQKNKSTEEEEEEEDSDLEMFDEDSEQEISQAFSSLENSLAELVSKKNESVSTSYNPPTLSVPTANKFITSKIVSAKYIPMKCTPTTPPATSSLPPNPSTPMAPLPVLSTEPVPSTSKPVTQSGVKKIEPLIKSLNGEAITLGLNTYVALDSDNNYECTLCKCSYTSYMKFLEHYENKHCEENTVEGNMVMNKRETMELIKKVKKRPVSYKLAFPCSICPCKYRQSFQLARHIQKHFAANKFLRIMPCPYCLIVFRKIGLLIEHMEKHITSPEEAVGYQCKICKKPFLKVMNLKHHMKVHDEVKKFSCSYCTKQFRFKSQLGTHMNIHRSEALMAAGISVTDSSLLPTCGICLQFFNAYEDLMTHVKESHAFEIKFYCGNCSVLCKDLILYLAHISEKHSENSVNEVFSCTLCRNDFQDEAALQRHFRKQHYEKTIHDCNFCKLIFTDINVLEKHVATYHPVRKPKKPVSKYVMNIAIPKVVNTPAVVPWAAEESQNEYCEEENEFNKQCKIVEANLKEISETHGKDLLEIDAALRESSLDIEDAVTFLETAEDVEENVHKSLPMIQSVTSPDETENNSYPCSICKQKFFDSESFVSHTLDELQQMTHKQIPCGICGVMFRKCSMLVSHIEKHFMNPGKDLTIECKICSRRFQNRHNFNSHVLGHSNHKRFKCKLCSNGYRHKLSWKKHMAFVHSDFNGTEAESLEFLPHVADESGNDVGFANNNISMVNSEISNNNYSEVIEMNITQTLANEDREIEDHYSCDICNTRYLYSTSLLDHIIEKHFDDTKLTCDFCDLMFTEPNLLCTHLAEHSKVRKHFCPVCGKGFKLRQIMTQHINLHSMERKFQCEKCIKSYRSRTSLSHHKRRDHDNRGAKFMCEYCSKICTTKSHLKRHLFLHTGNSPFICRTCAKVCHSSQRLKEHEYTHGNIKPYHCVKCQKGFISTKHWRNHMRNQCNVPEAEIVYIRPRFLISSDPCVL